MYLCLVFQISKSKEIAVTMDATEGAWDMLKDPEQFTEGITLIAGSICENKPQHVPTMVRLTQLSRCWYFCQRKGVAGSERAAKPSPLGP